MGAHPPILLGTLGMTDTLILMVMALVVFGPRRLPQIGRQIGKLMYEFRKASNDFKFQMEEELRNAEEADRRKKEEERQKAIAAALPEQASVSADPPVSVDTPLLVNAIESPYPGEGTYPPQYPPEGPATPSPVESTPVEESTPRITPPSTGEIVPANRPSRSTVIDEPVTETSAAASGETVKEFIPQPDSMNSAPKQPNDTAAEALNQHG
jgi:sec-independent protein translocase protein TatB